MTKDKKNMKIEILQILEIIEDSFHLPKGNISPKECTPIHKDNASLPAGSRRIVQANKILRQSLLMFQNDD